MKIFYDFEFLEDGVTIRPISLGMVREDGKGLYRVVKDYQLLQDICKHPWLRKNVVPSLPVTFDVQTGVPLWDELHLDYNPRVVVSEEQVAEDVRHFVADTPDPELWAYYAAYDHVALCQLFGRMIDLPTGFPMFTNDLKQEMVRLGNPRVPEQVSGEHNAYMDALWNKEVYEYLRTL